jgi:hypothetical protein
VGLLTRRAVARLALALTLVGVPVIVSGNAASQSDVAVKAAFLFNFAKFTEWPRLPAGAPITICVVDEDEIAASLAAIVRGQMVDGRAVGVLRSPEAAEWTACHILFIADTATRRAAAALPAIKALPVLTVSDDPGFARAGGIIELYVEAGRMRFAVNTAAVERSGVRLSSRLLGLAKLVGGSGG